MTSWFGPIGPTNNMDHFLIASALIAKEKKKFHGEAKLIKEDRRKTRRQDELCLSAPFVLKNRAYFVSFD